jgi:hypothetical protein
MAKWVDMGHAMRRRIGAPSNHFESAGPTGGRMHDTADEQYEVAKSQNSPRASIGEEQMSSENIEQSMSPGQDADSYAGKAAKPARGKMVQKGHSKSEDPTGYGAGPARSNVLYTERMGAQYRITVPFTPTVDPVAGPTMRNARTVPSVQGRQNPNFQGGMSDSMY